MRKVSIIVAVMPDYRRYFLDELRELSSDELEVIVGDEHLIATVRSSNLAGVSMVRNVGLFGRRLLWQRGALSRSFRPDVVVTDLNPRSITAWLILFSRAIMRKRTLVWGHLYPRQGPSARTVPLRNAMRRLASGFIAYTLTDRERAQGYGAGSQPAWAAPNGLYPSTSIWISASTTEKRTAFTYVGRLVEEKKVGLLLEAFRQFLEENGGPWRLQIVGDGPQAAILQADSKSSAALRDRVDFLGHISDVESLRRVYENTLCSVSPGYVGLSLTQSLGFGVPMLVADDEPHAPEVELMSVDGSGGFFESGDPTSLASAMSQIAADPQSWLHNSTFACDFVRDNYSATSMARGFLAALDGVTQ